MAVYVLEMRDDACRETERFEADSDAEAVTEAESMCREWVEGGDWGVDGASISAHWTLRDDGGEEVDSGRVEVEIDPDHDALIRAAGGDADCDHEWEATLEVEGGCRENPGVWSAGGTALSISDHCRHCGLRRHRHLTGSQRNPGEHDTVRYELPDLCD